MRVMPVAVALLMLGLTASSTAALFLKDRPHPPHSQFAEGEVRCEGAGAIVININGTDYAANGMASRRYPPVQRVWNSTTHPESDIDRIIVNGLTLCDWDVALNSDK